MDMTPQEIAGTTFRVVKKGFDPEEVRSFQVEVARELELAQNQASLMEQRARAAVAKAQGLAAAAAAGPIVTHGTEAGQPYATGTQPAVTSSAVAIRADDAETISRTLVLAQRTAEHTIAEATREAAEIRAAAEADAHDVVERARASGARLVSEAKSDARRAGEIERNSALNEVQALLARLDFLRGDVQEMEAYAATHRQRLSEAAEALRQMSERSILGPGDLRPPILSPAADMERTEVAAAAVVARAPEPAVVAPVAAAPVVAPPVVAPPVVAPPVVAPPVVAPPVTVLGPEPAPLEPAPVVISPAPEPVVAIAPQDQTPGVGSPLLPPLDLTFADMPTGEIPVVRSSSGPVSVPDLDDDWPGAARTVQARPNDLRILGD